MLLLTRIGFFFISLSLSLSARALSLPFSLSHSLAAPSTPLLLAILLQTLFNLTHLFTFAIHTRAHHMTCFC